jgi:hypothetical protein
VQEEEASENDGEEHEEGEFRREPSEVLGDTEVSAEGARDATSMEGMAYTLWKCVFSPSLFFSVSLPSSSLTQLLLTAPLSVSSASTPICRSLRPTRSGDGRRDCNRARPSTLLFSPSPLLFLVHS